MKAIRLARSRYLLRRSQRAISPVIATVILVAVTVGIAITVSLWAGTLTLQQQNTEELMVNQVVLQGNQATIHATNRGTLDIVITQIQASGAGISPAANTYVPSGTRTIPKGGSAPLAITVNFEGGQTAFTPGARYDFVLLTSRGNLFPATALA